VEKRLSNGQKTAAWLTLLSLVMGGSTVAMASTTASSNPINSEQKANHLSPGNSFEIAQRQDARSGQCRRVIGTQASPRSDAGRDRLAAFRNPEDVVGGKVVSSIPVGRTVTLASPYQEKRVADPEGTGKVILVAVTQAGTTDLLWIPVNRIKSSGGAPTTPSTLGICTGGAVRALW
jgi:hypothetical protein